MQLSKRPIVIAHRGSSGGAPEGTAAAIRLAIRQHSEMIELDVQMTKDRRLVIFHDERLERTTDGQGRLSNHTYGALARLDAGGWFSTRFRGERILLVSQALRLIPKPVMINLELKSRPRESFISRVIGCVRRSRAARRTLVSSFDASCIARVRAAAPSMATALICRHHAAGSLRQAVALGCAAWHPHVSLVTPSFVQHAHEHGLRVHAWTVDRAQQAQRLLNAGVDGVFTNWPDRIHPVCVRSAR